MKENTMFARSADTTFIVFETWNGMLWSFMKDNDRSPAKIAVKGLRVKNDLNIMRTDAMVQMKETVESETQLEPKVEQNQW